MAKKKEEITSTDYKAQIIDMVLNTENIVKLQALETFIESYLKTKPKIKVNADERLKVGLIKMFCEIKSEKSMKFISSMIQWKWAHDE